MINKDKIDLVDYIPETIICNEGNGQEVNLNFHYDEDFIHLSYIVEHYSNGKREYSYALPKFISKSNETFEILGLLQAECSKTKRGCFTFANNEPRLINKVIKWFEKELEFDKAKWRWYIKLNINEPKDLIYKKRIEKKLITYWRENIELELNRSYPKKVSYISHTNNKIAKSDDNGCCIIEYKNNLFSVILQNMVKKIFNNIVNYEIDSIKSFLKGIIAGEATIAYHRKSRHFGVHVSASKEEERIILEEAFKKLGVKLKIYNNYKETLISERENLVQLLKQRLMTLHPRKYNKFLNMMQQYQNISQETGYFTGSKKVWNKIPQEKINQILELYKSGITKTKDIADKLEISIIKVNRILKENNLGKRLIKIPEGRRKEIAQYARENQKLTQKSVAEYFNVNESIVRRAISKYC